ncbi:MAG TPA: hydroxymethylbilane synthase [Anaerolineales bacterium]
MTCLIFATRPSALARWQTQWVIAALQQAWPGLECREKIVTTQGDKILDRPLPEIGGKGLFTQELEVELLSGQVQAAVHSLKDLPVENPPGLVIGSVPVRGEARDALVSARGCTLESLPQGAVVGTSSLRRASQLLAYRPDLRVEPVRGNVETRLRKARDGQYDAVVLAGAGLVRLGLADQVSQWLPLEVMLPAPGQGALAVQCAAEDEETLHLLAALEDPAARRATTAERAFLQGLGGGCSLPVAAFARLAGGELELQGLAASPDGKRLVRVRGFGPDALLLGADAARQALAQGAGEFLHA